MHKMFLGIAWVVWLAGALFAVGLFAAVLTANAFRPLRRSEYFLVPSFLTSWLTAEYPAHHLAWQATAGAALISLGALGHALGWIGAVLLALSWIGLAAMFFDGLRAKRVFEAALRDIPDRPERARTPRRQLLLPIWRRRREVRVKRNIVFREVDGKRLKLDVVYPREPGKNRPAVIQVHGGAWVVGDKREQGWPLMTHLAAHGWVCFNINYRLSPGATFPDHLVDIKHALKWVRDHAEEWGVDPSFVAVTGGSAGGHLTAMTGLTANDPEYQQGIEDADTSVQAAVPFYGVYDFTDRDGTHHPTMITRLLEPLVLKAFFAKEPEKFSRASPMDRIHHDAPPFMIIHGDRDSLAPVSAARVFASLLREASSHAVVYAELPGAQHAFDVMHSVRTAHAINAVLRFLEHVHAAHQNRDSTVMPGKVSATGAAPVSA